MAVTKHSKQREALIEELCSRYDHPTAEDLYVSLKKRLPNLSLGTVYRNLSTLCSDGKILKISVDGADRYDGNVNPHVHILCNKCGKMDDVFTQNGVTPLNNEFLKTIPYKIDNYSIILYGTCLECEK